MSIFNICLFADVGRAVTFTFSPFKSPQLSSDFRYPVVSLVASLHSESDTILHDNHTLLFQCANLHIFRTWVNREQLESKLLLVERIQNNSISRILYCSRVLCHNTGTIQVHCTIQVQYRYNTGTIWVQYRYNTGRI